MISLSELGLPNIFLKPENKFGPLIRMNFDLRHLPVLCEEVHELEAEGCSGRQIQTGRETYPIVPDGQLVHPIVFRTCDNNRKGSVPRFFLADVSCSLHPGGLRKVPRKYHKKIAETLKECLSDPGRLQDYTVHLDKRGLSRAANTIHRFNRGLMNYRAFPPEFWKKIRTTNLLKRVNRELKRRSKKIGAFPN